MDLPAFFTHVAALIKPPAVIKPTLTDKRVALVHSALGVAGEIFEVAELVAQHPSNGTMPKHSIIEELGDVFFYTTDIATIVGHTAESFGTRYGYASYAGYATDREAFFDLCKAGELFVDFTKKVFAYDDKAKEAELQELLDPAFAIVIRVMAHYNTQYGLSPGFILSENFEKLKERYPKGYSDAAAAERADKSQDGVLTGEKKA